jgi:hypothetical protein
MPLSGIEEAVSKDDERLSSEAALTALSALRLKTRDGSGKEIEVAPRWMELYQRLVEGGWGWRVAVYIAWAAQPKRDRDPQTQEDLAIKCLGLNSDRAIATWRKKNQSIDETISMLQGSIIFDSLSDAFGAMVEVATEPDYKGHQDRKLLFEMAGVYTPSSKITAEMAKRITNSNSHDLEDLPDEELRRIEKMAGDALESKHRNEEEAE